MNLGIMICFLIISIGNHERFLAFVDGLERYSQGQAAKTKCENELGNEGNNYDEQSNLIQNIYVH